MNANIPLLLTALLSLTMLQGTKLSALSSSLVSDRPRVAIVQNKFGKSVRAADGTVLRGGAAWVYQYGRKTGATNYINDAAYWKAIQDKGLNAVRLIAFDPWQRAHGDPAQYPNGYEHADLQKPEDVAALLKDIDTVVDMASRHGLYVLINYHDVGGYRDPDRKKQGSYGPTIHYITRFWSLVAPRYANRTHVFYELTNEPVQWYPQDYKDEHLRDFKVLYDLVRRYAPQTHIVLLSFANTHSDNPNVSMLTVARRLKVLGVNFTNASVGFHPYNTGGTSAPILALMKEFPVINTEQNFPDNFGVVTDGDSDSLDGELLGVQTMERLGVSWFHWKIDGPKNLKNNLEKLRQDAQEKGYLWRLVSPLRR
ncbi:glycoside hydrolase family 5 protein [Floridanema aerugineum]|uniref:Glycoside hydrolase family 5 protein n=1 Tax=Floridaenema aerugineum BLCC-F46 TaxID=3153654 RepID=A0ABV4WZC9_9CYAN